MTALQTTAQFLNSLGVNVHVEYTDGKYANGSTVVSDLHFLGVDHVRDAALNPSNQGQGNYDTLASAGIKFDMFMQGLNLSSTLKLVDSFVSRHPGSVSMIEGPNEVNNFPISYNGSRGNAAAVAYQSALYTAVHSDTALAGVPVANLTSYPALAGAADFANFHSYPKGGAEPLGTLNSDMGQEAAVEAGKTMVMTEGGYHTLVQAGSDGVDEATQAKYLLNLYFDNAKAGVQSSYVYELLDAYADPTNSDSEKHYGLFHLDNTPKLVATAIHNLTTVLSTGVDASASSSPLAYSTSGLPSSGASLLLTKAAEVHDLVLWNEPSAWDKAAAHAIATATTSTGVHLDDLSDVTVFDPLAGANAVASYHGVHDLSVGLSDHPLILEITQAASAAPTDHSVTGSAPPVVAGALMGGADADSLVASASPATIFGMGGDDTILGAGGADTLFGNMGNDSISAGDGDDLVFGGRDNDILYGDSGNDALLGNLGADTLHGGTGADSLFGGQGNDVLFGDSGDDWLSGDLGDDTLTGGAGNDTFAFAPGSGHDTVTDFTKGQDRIDVSAYLSAHDTFTIADDGANARVTFSTGDTIEVLGVHANALSVSGGWIV